MEVATDSNLDRDAKRFHALEQTPRQHFWWAEQAPGPGDVDATEQGCIFAQVFNTG
jgi:hypothetical protein